MFNQLDIFSIECCSYLETVLIKMQISFNADFYRDLNWFNTFLTQYNGVTFYDNQIRQETVSLDASLQGLGRNFDKMVYALPIPKCFKNFTIIHLEMLHLVVALKI